MSSVETAPLYYMALDVLQNILARSDNLTQVSDYVTSTMREFTGARAVSLFAESALTESDEGRVLSVCPERKSGDITVHCCSVLNKLGQCKEFSRLMTVDDIGDEAGLNCLKKASHHSVLVIPLIANAERLGSLLFFDLPEKGERIQEVLSFINPLQTLLGLILNQSLILENQERVIEERTNSLARSEAFYRTLFDNAPYPIAIVDANSGIIRDVNIAFENLSGKARDDIAGKHQNQFHPEDAAKTDDGFTTEFVQHQASPGTVTCDLLQCADGSIREVEIKSSFLDIEESKILLGFFNDVTERNASARALKDREALISSLMASTAEAIYGIDKDGNCIFVNASCLKMLGYQYETELLGKNLHEIFHHSRPDGTPLDPVNCNIQNAMRSGNPTHSADEVFWKRDGESFPVEYWVYPLHAGGEISGAVVTFFDITEKLAAEFEHRRMEEQLFQSQKLEALGTLAGGIAHDFNNILAAIMGYTELTASKLAMQSQERDDLDNVLLAASRAKDLVQQILAFSRKATSEAAPMSMGLIVAEAMSLLRQTIPTTVEFQLDIDKEAGFVTALPSQIHQVVMNLCTNAYHAMREKGGTLSVSLHKAEVLDSSIQETFGLKPGTYVRLKICDTGTGMDSAVLTRIFEPYFTTKPLGEGTGLGLSVVHGIVRNVGGKVFVESEPGKGTTFTIYLPGCQSEAPCENIVIPNAETKTHHAAARILFVDDEPALAGLGKKLLESAGYEVTSTTSSMDALDLFAKSPDQFDLIITDQTMPGLTGAELVRKALQIRPDIATVICTGYSDVLDDEGAKRLGVTAFALKPLNRGHLLGVVQKALG